MKKYTICNPIMFGLVMQNPTLCKGLLERIFPERKIRDVRLITPDEEDEERDTETYQNNCRITAEATVLTGVETRAIRMDVLFEEDEAWYDIELQLVPGDHPAKRSRYYHASKTVSSLQTGRPYAELRPGYVIFICMFDLFKLNCPIYSFEMYDVKNYLPLDDGQYTIFLNALCMKNVPKELDTFFQYLRTGKVPEGDLLLTELEREVQAANRLKEVRQMATVQDEMDRLQAYIEVMRAEAESKAHELEAVSAEAEKMNRLTEILVKQNRTDELLEAIRKPQLRKKLMEELL